MSGTEPFNFFPGPNHLIHKDPDLLRYMGPASSCHIECGAAGG